MFHLSKVVVCILASTASLLSVSLKAQAEQITLPMITVACVAFQDRASTFDCMRNYVAKEGSVTYDTEWSEVDRAIVIRQAYVALTRPAVAECGGRNVCRAAYGVIGYQCIAIAQSPFFSGFGSFMGKETTQAQAEATAIQDCEEHVGDPGAACEIVVSRCPDLSPNNLMERTNP